MEGKTHQNIAKKTHELLVNLAHNDPLTGLLNRRGAVSEFNVTKSNLDRVDKFGNYSLVIMDLVGLKCINDNLGYDKGNEILKDSSYSIQSNIRKTDLAIRLGGDEFLLVFFNSDIDGSKKSIEKINNNLPDNTKFCIGYKTFSPDSEFEDNLLEMEKKLDELKKSMPHDENDRVKGEGVVVQLS
jgi:diguanylate cyclase (GGDEF)-like protein